MIDPSPSQPRMQISKRVQRADRFEKQIQKVYERPQGTYPSAVESAQEKGRYYQTKDGKNDPQSELEMGQKHKGIESQEGVCYYGKGIERAKE